MNTTQKQKAIEYASSLLQHLKTSGAYSSTVGKLSSLLDEIRGDNVVNIKVYERGDRVVRVDSPQVGFLLYDMDEEEECKESYLMLYALQTYLLEQFSESQRSQTHFNLTVLHLHTYNVLDKYLGKWKNNAWMGSKGPVPHLDLMKSLWNILQQVKSYRVHYEPQL